jgi:hypothetical protein
MAVRSIHSRLIVGTSAAALDFSAQSTGFTIDESADTLDDTTLQASDASSVVGVVSSTITQNGLWRQSDTDATANIEQTMQQQLGSQTATVAALLDTTTADCPASVIPSAGTGSMAIEMVSAELLRINGTWSGGAMQHGKRIFGRHSTWSSGVISAVGTQTHIDIGAAGASGGWIHVFLQSLTGATTGFDIELQSSTDSIFTTPLSEGITTHTAVGVQSVQLSGAVERYLRLNVQDLGGATNGTVTAIVVVNGVTSK